MTKTARLEFWIWVLIYAGLLLLCVGYFTARQDANDRNLLGGALMLGGGGAAVLGVVLIYVRSRLIDPAPQKDNA